MQICFKKSVAFQHGTVLGTGLLGRDTVANESYENHFLGESVEVLLKDGESTGGANLLDMVDGEVK